MMQRASRPHSPDSGPQPSFAPVLLGNFFLRLAGAATGLMLTLYLGWINRELYPVSATTLGLLAGGYYLVEMVAAPIFGAQSDRWGRGPLLLLGPALGLVAVELTGLTTVLVILFVTRLLEGLAGAATTPALLGYLSERTDGDGALRGRVMSLFEAGTTVGLALGAVGGSLLWDALGRAGFFAVGGLYLVSFLAFWWTRRLDKRVPCSPNVGRVRRAVLTADAAPGNDEPDNSPRPLSLLQSVRTVARYRPLIRFMPAWLAVNAVVGLWLTHAVYQMTSGRDLAGQYLVGAFSSQTVAIILAGYTVTFGIGITAWGFAFRWLSETVVMRVAMAAMLSATAALSLMNHSGGPGPPLWLGVAAFVVSVLIESGFAPAAVSYLARLSAGLRADRGLFMGLYSVVLGMGQLLGSWIGGPFADRWGMDGILALTAALGLAALGLTMRLRSTP